MRVLRFLTVVLLFPCQLLLGDTIVNWGGVYTGPGGAPLAGNAYIGGGLNLDGDVSQSDEIGGRAFSASSLFSPPIGPAYSGTSAQFYGGAIVGRSNYSGADTAFDGAEVKNQGPHDSVHLHASQSSHKHDLHAAFLWDKSNFLNYSSQNVFFDANSFATFSMGSSSNETLLNAQVRLLVREGANSYFLSKTAWTSPDPNKSFTWNVGNQGLGGLTDGDWASFDPNAAMGGFGAGTDLRFDQLTATFTGKKFSSITGIGFFVEQDTFHNNLDFHWEGFQVNAVPEPSSLAALAGLGLYATIGIRRRRQA